ncbi:Na(+) H(+) antiporter subunit E [Serinicoccus hydrothermalis]|uniref:Na(+) H(+) antiporter subunit E n=1 Tax=Serinicoccus hydrothermalis TaxID=1758689 RepID=A0A1B1NBW2_9MICO|nr:Na+/H+ antiporter subunit E [Serinicoccus hydrothermalis]ANS78912.1 Na(+) H(+) antiporter subunit E [Serinicoccus hydrothermalis]
MLNPLRAAVYGGWLAGEVIRGALRIGADVVTPGLRMSPAIVELPLHCETDLEISTMASSITITPGTITVGIAPRTGHAPPTLYVHAIYGHDRDEVIAELRVMERHLLVMTRGRSGSDRAMEVEPS